MESHGSQDWFTSASQWVHATVRRTRRWDGTISRSSESCRKADSVTPNLRFVRGIAKKEEEEEKKKKEEEIEYQAAYSFGDLSTIMPDKRTDDAELEADIKAKELEKQQRDEDIRFAHF